MNRIIGVLAGVASASSLMLADSAIKAAVLLCAAVVATVLLGRDSASTRHFVWLLAMVSILLVPLLSAILPQWRVLPAWEGRPPQVAAQVAGWLPSRNFTEHTVEAPRRVDRVAVGPAIPMVDGPETSMPNAANAPAAPKIDVESPTPRLNWGYGLPMVWAMGCAALLMRLLAARWTLWNSERQASVVGTAEKGSIPDRFDDGRDVVSLQETFVPNDDCLVRALEAARAQLGIGRSITLLIHHEKTIPIVWGIFRCRLLLPAAARQWSDEQLRSVMLHELAHIRRHDTTSQLLTQIACALHWFNPLVWIAAWRMHVECERACDDLVLDSGVRPSSYAGHLLEVVARLSPVRGVAASGLAMARPSTLEGRVRAILCPTLNRRRLTGVLTVAAIVVGATIAIPLAMLRGAEEKVSADDGRENATNTATLDAAVEAQMDWGAPVNGLRGALVIRSSGAGKSEAIYLALQNVSEAPLRFVDTTKSERLRTLYMSDTKGILAGLSNEEPTMTDVTLQPREVVYLSMMPAENDQVNAVMIEGIRKDSLQTWRAVLNMEFAARGDAWSGKLTTGETRCALRDGVAQPRNKEAQALFKVWQNSARLDGDIPGGLVRLLHEKVKEFIRNNERDAGGAPYAQKMKPHERRFANTGDWKAADVVALLDDIASASTIPLETTLDHLARNSLKPGSPLPPALNQVDWGAPLESGLRMAYELEPQTEAYHLGTEIKARILLHNTGKEPVSLITTSFQQPQHSARLAGGAELQLDSTYWTTLGRKQAYRLAPGEYCEIYTPGLGIGAQDNSIDDWANVRAGSWIRCAAGDEVIFTPGVAMLFYENEGEPKADWWLDFITERLNRETPVPTDRKEREYLLYRVVRELYGAAPSTTEGDAFASDESPDALQNLAKLLAQHPYGKRSAGLIRAGSTTFRVLPADANADQRPRVATGPGWYSLSDDVKLSVTRRPLASTVVNEASIIYFQQGKENFVSQVSLPSGYDTWAAAMKKDAKELWVAEAGMLRRYDFTNPLQPLETRYEASGISNAPIPDELRVALDPFLSKSVSDAPKLKQAAPPPAAAPEEETKQRAGDPGTAVNRPVKPPEAVIVEIAKGGSLRVNEAICTLDELKALASRDPKRRFIIRTDEDVSFATSVEVLEAIKAAGVTDVMLANAERDAKLTPERLLGTWRGTVNGKNLVISFHRPPAEKDVQVNIYRDDATIGVIATFTIAPDGESLALARSDGSGGSKPFGVIVPTEPGTLRLKLSEEGNVASEAANVVLTRDAEVDATEPRQKEARELFGIWKQTANADGTIPGTFIGRLASEVRTYVKLNPTLYSAGELPKLLPRFVTSRDWTQAQSIELLDDVAYYSTKPIEAAVANAKLPSDALWRTKVELEDIPVRISQWSEPKKGLRIGVHIAGGEWRNGEKVRVELWLHNVGNEQVMFEALPDDAPFGVTAWATDAEGNDHWSVAGSFLLPLQPELCTLPSGYVARVRAFDLPFADGVSESEARSRPKFIGLTPGSYKLHLSWLDSTGPAADPARSQTWRGALETPEFAFKLMDADKD